MVDLVFNNETDDKAWSEEFFKKILVHAISRTALGKKKVEIGLYLVTPERSQELNLQYRKIDKPTDVLSFPLHERGLEKYGILPLGDIFICPKVAKQQAEKLKIPLDHELARLAVHGFLHLLGHDHERTDKEAEAMFDVEEKILNSFKL